MVLKQFIDMLAAMATKFLFMKIYGLLRTNFSTVETSDLFIDNHRPIFYKNAYLGTVKID
jgi:hypothetical protein